MDPSRLRPVDDVSIGAWLAPRLGPFGPCAGSIVPRGYEALARVLHPVARADDPLVSWADVCATTGQEPHALMRWDDIAGVMAERVDRSLVASAWLGPGEGNLHPLALRRLCRLLEPHTSTADRCYFALWEGYDWIHASPSAGTFRPERPRSPRLRWRFPWRWRLRPGSECFGPGAARRGRTHTSTVALHRDYLLFSGSLDAATAMGSQAEDDWFLSQSPNLFWPDDHAWCVATEVDRRSTLVGGTARLIASIVGDVELEAWPVGTDDWVD